MDAEKLLEGFLGQMQETSEKFTDVRNGLLEVSLMPFEALFQKDNNGKYVSSNLEKKDVDEIMKSFDEDLIPMFKENKYEKGIEKINEWKKLLGKNLEKQK